MELAERGLALVGKLPSLQRHLNPGGKQDARVPSAQKDRDDGKGRDGGGLRKPRAAGIARIRLKMAEKGERGRCAVANAATMVKVVARSTILMAAYG